MTFGTPIYDDNGAIKNAIVYCHGSLGNYASVKKLAPFLGKNDAFDENKYFFICISALGSPGSCSPSTTDLKNKFPKYSINDVVNFQKKFLSEKFNIEQFKIAGEAENNSKLKIHKSKFKYLTATSLPPP